MMGESFALLVHFCHAPSRDVNLDHPERVEKRFFGWLRGFVKNVGERVVAVI